MTYEIFENQYQLNCSADRCSNRLNGNMLQYLNFDNRGTCSTKPVADLHSKMFDAHPLGPIFFIFMQCSANFGQMIGWRLLGNPGFATESICEMTGSVGYVYG